MIDLNKIVNDTVEKLKDEGFIEKVVKEKLEEVIKNKVSEILDRDSNREILNFNINADDVLRLGSRIKTQNMEEILREQAVCRKINRAYK